MTEQKTKGIEIIKSLEHFETEVVKMWFEDLISEIPELFFVAPLFSDRRYHTTQQCDKAGLLVHALTMQAAVESILPVFPELTPSQRDMIRCFPVLHDCMLYTGAVEDGYAMEHPRYAASFVLKTATKHDVPVEMKEFLATMITVHSGGNGYNALGDQTLPAQKTSFLARLGMTLENILSSNWISYEMPDNIRTKIANL